MSVQRKLLIIRFGRFYLHYIVTYYCVFVLTGAVVVNGVQWTEQDESRRIAELKKEEKRLFEKEMGGPVLFGKSSEETTFDYASGLPLASAQLPSPVLKLENVQPPSFFSTVNRQSMPLPTNNSNNWCFHCASPWSSIPSEMQQVVRNLLEVRRSVYPPKEFVTSSCTTPRNIDSLARQSCLYSYCQTLILTDHETGSAFTLRGCAENFGAIEEELLRRRGDNTCKRLHNDVDIQECICKNRKYCYAGAERRSIRYTETLKQPEHFIKHSKAEKRQIINAANIETWSKLLTILCSITLALWI